VRCRETVDRSVWVNVSSREYVDVNFHMMVPNCGTTAIYTDQCSNC